MTYDKRLSKKQRNDIKVARRFTRQYSEGIPKVLIQAKNPAWSEQNSDQELIEA